jgi:hypothetical protein
VALVLGYRQGGGKGEVVQHSLIELRTVCFRKAGNLRPCLNAGSLKKLRIDDFEKQAPGVFLRF